LVSLATLPGAPGAPGAPGLLSVLSDHGAVLLDDADRTAFPGKALEHPAPAGLA